MDEVDEEGGDVEENEDSAAEVPGTEKAGDS